MTNMQMLRQSSADSMLDQLGEEYPELSSRALSDSLGRARTDAVSVVSPNGRSVLEFARASLDAVRARAVRAAGRTAVQT